MRGRIKSRKQLRRHEHGTQTGSKIRYIRLVIAYLQIAQYYDYFLLFPTFSQACDFARYAAATGSYVDTTNA